jgi:hypothetical protein
MGSSAEFFTEQVHQVYPSQHLFGNLGIGSGPTPSGKQLVLKSRLNGAEMSNVSIVVGAVA